jgi:aspartate/methionine/tyrosine aminotransferase
LKVKDSWDFAFALMQQAHVAVTPGRDFGSAETHKFIRFSTASALPQLQQAVGRLQTLLG